MGAKLGALPHDDGTLGHVEYLPERVRWREKKEAELMRRIVLVFAVLAVMMAVVAASAIPSFAQPQPASGCGVFLPATAQSGPGAVGQLASSEALSGTLGQLTKSVCNPTS